MKKTRGLRWAGVASGLFLLQPPDVAADVSPFFNWTISASSTNPYVNSGTPTGAGVTTRYLWFVGDLVAVDVTHAEFGIVTGGALLLVGITPRNGFTVSGDADQLVVTAPGGCASGTLVAAWLQVWDFPGTMCFAPSSATGLFCSSDCAPGTLGIPGSLIGFASDGSTPCEVQGIGECPAVSPVGAESGWEAAPWGRVKSLYR